MSAGAMPWLVAAVVVPLVVNEFKEWWPWLAKRLVRWAARRLGDSQACARYEEEWVANLEEVPGYLSPLLAAFGYVAAVPRMRWTLLRRSPPLTARPKLLPHVPRDFVGRDTEVAFLDSRLLSRGGKRSARRDTSVVVVVSGTAGVGKTCLAVWWAHRQAKRFPDGALYINLGGYVQDSPVSTGEALRWLLEMLGVHADRVPASMDDRALLYRTMTARRRMMIVLDNASSVAQVRPLMVDSPGSLMLITSRSMFPEPADAHHVALDVLSYRESLVMMRSILGTKRVDAQLDATIELIQLCAHLPLAIRIAAERAASRPRMPIEQMVRDLRDESARLASLTGSGDGVSAVRTVFDWYYRALPMDASRMFRRLGALPSTRRHFTLREAALLAECAESVADMLLEGLVGAGLVERSSPTGAYRLHGLLHVYAAAVLAAEEPHLVTALCARLDPPSPSPS